MVRRTFFQAGLAGVAFAQAPAPPKTTLKVGDDAPDFTVPTTLGKPFQLSSFKGKSGVVVAFFPAAFTGGWTKEMTGYQAGIQRFQEMGFEVIGISTDNTPSLKYWADNVIKPSFPFGSDFMRKTAQAYGVLMPERGIANRATFVVDKDGKIQYIEEGNTAVSIDGAEAACKRIKK